MEENKEVSKDIKSRFDKILSLGKKDKETQNDKYIKQYEEKFGKKVVILEDIITYSKAIELIKESLKHDRDLLSEYISEKK